MEITKVNKDEIICVGREALGKVRNNELDVFENITLSLAFIIDAGLDGYRIRIPFYEFSDFSDLITKVTKAETRIALISIPRNPPLNVLNGIRRITDNAIHSITNIDLPCAGNPEKADRSFQELYQLVRFEEEAC